MQTFLPYQSFKKSAAALDNKRLGKQRVEAMQILKTLQGISSGWRNHPAVKMWRGHEKGLMAYYNTVCREWMNRGFKQTMPLFDPGEWEGFQYPGWLTPEFCLSHRSNLIRKAPEFYVPIFGSDVPDDLPYVWPV